MVNSERSLARMSPQFHFIQQIPHRFALDITCTLTARRPATKRLSYGKDRKKIILNKISKQRFHDDTGLSKKMDGI